MFRTDTHGSVVLSIDDQGKAYYRTESDVDPIRLECQDSPVSPDPAPLPEGQFGIYRVEAVAECITLINNGASIADLGGWTISDGEGNYTFPTGTLVEPGATHKVCMETYNPTQYTRGLYLNNDDDCVLLFAPGNWTPVDTRCW